MTQTPIPQEVKDAIRQTNLAYLYDQAEATPYKLTRERRVTVHGMVMQGKLVRGIQSSAILPTGTEGFLFESKELHYDKYVWVHDEQYPAKDAKVVKTNRHLTWVSLYRLETGDVVLVDAYEFVEGF